MSSYSYSALDRNGEVHNGEVEAVSEGEARDLVWGMGLTPFAIEPARAGSWWHPEVRSDAAVMTDKQVASFARDMSVLLLAGVALDVSLRVVTNNSVDARVRTAAGLMRDEILKGSEFTAAFRKAQGSREADYLNILEVGDIGGDTGGALRHVADLLERRLETRGRIVKALVYPGMLIVMAIASLGVVVGFLLPAVMPIYTENRLPLPPILSFLDFIGSHAVELLAATSVGAATILLAAGVALRKPGIRLALARTHLALPLVGTILKLRDAASFIRTISTLLSAGVPLVQAYESSIASAANEYCRQQLRHGKDEIREGVRLSAVFESGGALPPLAHQLVAIGEETGKLREMLTRAAEIFERQEQDRTNGLVASLAPAITIAIAGLIAGIILSIMSTILSINDLVMK